MSKIRHYILTFLLLVFITNFTNCKARETKRKINVGTVLFSEIDCARECWNCENIALLTTRMLLEDLLPNKNILIIKDDAFITDIIDYFRLVLEVVRKITHGKTKHLTLLALTDLLGGYLHRYVIPTAKHAYYSGYLNFESMENLLQLYEELKNFLRTNGYGWAKPITIFSNKMQPQPLEIPPPAPKSDACKGLIYVENPNDQPNKCSLTIPLPFFDSKTNPSAIAVPFKTYSLRNVESKSASYILVKFYIAATKCLGRHSTNHSNMSDFNNEFYGWVRTQVLPHLLDDKFYSAFGGVLRLQQSLLKLGAHDSGKKKIGNYNIMPEDTLEKELEKSYSKQGEKRKKSDLILMALLATIFVWFLLGSLFICYRIKVTKNRKEESGLEQYDGTSKPKFIGSIMRRKGGLKKRSESGKRESTKHENWEGKPGYFIDENGNLRRYSDFPDQFNQYHPHFDDPTIAQGDEFPSYRDEPSFSNGYPDDALLMSKESDMLEPMSLTSQISKTSISPDSETSGTTSKSTKHIPCQAPCATGEEEDEEDVKCKICPRKRSQSAKTTTATDTRDITANPWANDSILSENARTSLEDLTIQNNQLMFKYDLDTSSSSAMTTRDQSDDDTQEHQTENFSK